MLITLVSNGQTWLVLSSGTTNKLNVVAFCDQFHGVIAGDNATLKTTSDGGLTWTPAQGIPSVGYRGACICWETSGPHIFIAGDSGIIITSSGGTGNWQTLPTGTTYTLNDIKLFGSFSSIGYAVGENGTILRTNDGGSNWSALSVPSAAGLSLKSVSIDPTTSNRAYIVGQNGFVIQTTDGGTTWTQNPLYSNLSSVVYVMQNFGYVAGSFGNIWYFNGTYFGDEYSGITNGLNSLSFAATQVGLAVGANGCILLFNTWKWNIQTSPVTTNLNGVSAISVGKKDNSWQYNMFAWAVGDNGVLISTNQTVVGIDQAGKEVSSPRIIPNPCNGLFRIEGLSQGPATIEVTDLSGRTIATTDIPLDGQINLSELQSGLYSVTIRQGNNIFSRKLGIKAR